MLKFISGQLRRELPGLRGFSENNLKNMRKFYEAWKVLDKTTIAIVESLGACSQYVGRGFDCRNIPTKEPKGYTQSAKIAKEGGSVAKAARKQLESKTGKSAISSSKASDYLLPPTEDNED